jgi:hypothetical protein
MTEEQKIYSVLSFLLDKKPRSTFFYLSTTNKEYHLLRDSEIIILLSYDRGENEYEISTMDFTDKWINLDLLTLMQTQSFKDQEVMWKHLNYFGITPDKIYDLYSNDNFSYVPEYETNETDFDRN